MNRTAGRGLRLAAAVCLTVVAAGCATENTASTGSDENGVTETTIKVGGVVTKTSAIGFSLAEAEIGARARFERANAEGGVHGRKIDFIGAEDDGMVPDKGVTAARKLVQREKVFAVVPVVATAFGGGEFLEQQGTPWFSWMTNPPWCGKKTAFGWNGCSVPPPETAKTQSWWSTLMAEELGGSEGKSAYLIGTDSSASQYGVGIIGKGFAATGFRTVTAEAAVPQAAPPTDWSPYVNKVMKSVDGGAPDVVVSVMSGTKFNTGFYTALRKAGFKGAITDAVSYDPKLIADEASSAALEGVYPSVTFAPFESDVPEVAQMKADIERTAGADAVYSQHTASGYWAADIFLKILDETGEDLTRASFLAAAENFSYRNPGFGEIDYPQDKTESNGCGALVQVRNGAYTVAQPLECHDNVSTQ
ncbi:ABC transporter substrate-binding protein [Actinocorallia aurea]